MTPRQGAKDETATLNSNHFLENDTLVEVVVGLWGHCLKNKDPPQKKQIRKVQRVEETELFYQCAYTAALFPTGMLGFEIHTTHTLRLGSNGKNPSQ